MDGVALGPAVGTYDAIGVGLFVGFKEFVGARVGTDDGVALGAAVGS